MKKLFVTGCFLLAAVYCFAEFVLSPSVGFSCIDVKTDYSFKNGGFSPVQGVKQKFGWIPMTVSLDLGVVSDKGFTFLWDNNLSFIGSAKQTDGSVSKKINKINGAFYDGNLLFGYTYKGVKNLYINLAAGLGGGIGVIRPRQIEGQNVSAEKTGILTTGIPIHLGVQYFFTKRVGLNLSLVDVPCWSTTLSPFSLSKFIDIIVGSQVSALDSQYSSQYGGSLFSPSASVDDLRFFMGFTNIFRIKLGPIFRF